MFTGLIEQQAIVVENSLNGVARRLIIQAQFEELRAGESIAVNGACLTLLPDYDNNLAFDVSPETLAITTLAQLVPGDKVNLERAMSASGRLGGHYVSGHVDTTACILAIKPIDEYIEMVVGDFFVANAPLYLLPKGSITLEGVSLTINAVNETSIHLMLVPHTLRHSTFGNMQVGQRLNVEFDYFTRIVAHQLSISGQLKSEVE